MAKDLYLKVTEKDGKYGVQVAKRPLVSVIELMVINDLNQYCYCCTA